MTQISAAENLLIDIIPNRWRLVHAGENGSTPRVLVEATRETPFRYTTSFGRARRLPADGSLPALYIREVVLGWSAQDESWHLGLLLVKDMAETRGSRWCEIVHWPDPDQTAFAELAREAGESLAQTLNRPFDLIRPRNVPAAADPPPDLPELPLNAGLWTLESAGADHQTDGVVFVRAGRWMTGRIFRVVWYLFLAIVYIALSLATLQTDLALPNAGTMLPNPELLPYLGLGVAALLFGMIGYILIEMLSYPDRIVADATTHSVSAYRGRGERWRVSIDQLQAVYVTQVVNKRGRRRNIFHAELNLYLTDGTFKQMLQHVEQEELPGETQGPAQDGVTPLNRHSIHGDLQAAGLYVAEALGNIPCWYDQRTR